MRSLLRSSLEGRTGSPTHAPLSEFLESSAKSGATFGAFLHLRRMPQDWPRTKPNSPRRLLSKYSRSSLANLVVSAPQSKSAEVGLGVALFAEPCQIRRRYCCIIGVTGQVLRWVACSCDREKLLWLPEQYSGRSSPYGQLSAMASGSYRLRIQPVDATHLRLHSSKEWTVDCPSRMSASD